MVYVGPASRGSVAAKEWIDWAKLKLGGKTGRW